MSDAEKAPAWMKRLQERRSLRTSQGRRRDSQEHRVLVGAFEKFDESVEDSVVIERPRRHQDDERENAQEQVFEKAVFNSGGFSGGSFRHALVSRRLDGLRGEFVAEV